MHSDGARACSSSELPPPSRLCRIELRLRCPLPSGVEPIAIFHCCLAAGQLLYSSALPHLKGAERGALELSLPASLLHDGTTYRLKNTVGAHRDAAYACVYVTVQITCSESQVYILYRTVRELRPLHGAPFPHLREWARRHVLRALGRNHQPQSSVTGPVRPHATRRRGPLAARPATRTGLRRSVGHRPPSARRSIPTQLNTVIAHGRIIAVARPFGSLMSPSPPPSRARGRRTFTFPPRGPPVLKNDGILWFVFASITDS